MVTMKLEDTQKRLTTEAAGQVQPKELPELKSHGEEVAFKAGLTGLQKPIVDRDYNPPEEEKRDIGFEDVKDSFTHNWSLASLFKSMSRDRGTGAIDEEFLTSGVDDEEWKQITEGIDTDLLYNLADKGYLNKSQLLAQAEHLREHSAYRKRTGELGWKGTAMDVAFAVADPVTWAVPIASWASKGGKITQTINKIGSKGGFVGHGALAAAPEVVAESLMQIDNPDRGGFEMALAAGLPFVVGGALGSHYERKMRKATKESEAFIKEQIKRQEMIAADRKAVNQPIQVKTKYSDAEVMRELRAQLAIKASNKMSRGERKKLEKEIKDLSQQQEAVGQEYIGVTEAFKRKGVAENKNILKSSRTKTMRDGNQINDTLDNLLNKQDVDNSYRSAEAELSRLDQFEKGLIDMQPTTRKAIDDLREVMGEKTVEALGPNRPLTDLSGRIEDARIAQNNFMDEINKGLPEDQGFIRAKWAKLRLDFTGRLLNRTESITANRTIPQLHEVGIGLKGDVVTPYSANEYKQSLLRDINKDYYSAINDHWDQYLDLYGGLKTTIGVDRNTLMNDFSKKVGVAIRWGDDFATGIHPYSGKLKEGEAEILQQMAKKMANVQAKALEEARKAGVQGIQATEAKLNYLSRRWDNDMLNKIGRDNAVELFKKAILKGSMDVAEDRATAIAKGFFTAIANRKAAALTRGLSGKGLDHGKMDQLKDIFKKEGIDMADDELNALLRPFELTEKSVKKITPANHRLDLDEKAYIDTDNGRVFLTDLMDGDAFRLIEGYTQQMTGAAGLATKGINSLSDVNSILAKIGNETENIKEVDDVSVLFNDLLGRSNHDRINGRLDFGDRGTKVMRGLRAYQTANLMGQVALAQFADFGAIAGNAGFKAMMHHVPAMRKIFKKAQKGEVDHELSAIVSRYLHQGNQREFFRYGQAAGSTGAMDDLGHGNLGAAMDGLQRQVLMKSGMMHITDMQKAMAGSALMERMIKSAQKGKHNPRIMRSLGVTEEMEKRINAFVKNGDAVVSETGILGKKINEFNMEKFFETDPEAADVFVKAIDRWTRRTVMEEGFGDLPLYMHSELGKMLFQFRRFMFMSHNKMFLWGLSARDYEQFSGMMTSMFIATLVYVGQAQMNANGRDDSEEYMERNTGSSSLKDLYNNPMDSNISKILTSAAARTGQLSMPLPILLHFVEGALGEEVVGDFRSTTQMKSFLDPSGTPTGRFLSNSAGVVGGITSGIGQQFFDQDREGGYATAGARAVEMLPFYRLYGLHGFLKGYSQELEQLDE